MTTMPAILFVSTDISSANFLRRALGDAARLSCLSPEALSGATAVSGFSLVLLDGASLGPGSIDVARRVRWLGCSRPVVLAWEGAKELDRAIAAECGISEILASPLHHVATLARLTTHAKAEGDVPHGVATPAATQRMAA